MSRRCWDEGDTHARKIVEVWSRRFIHPCEFGADRIEAQAAGWHEVRLGEVRTDGVGKIQWKRKNRVWQRTHRQGTIKKRLSIHSNAPCLLERRISEHPHFKHTIGSWLPPSVRCFLLWWVDITAVSKKGPHRRSGLRGRKEWTGAPTNLIYP